MEAPDYCYQFLFFIFQIILIGANFTSPYYSCFPGVSTAGVTVPKGDIIIEYGDALEIYCMLNPKNQTYNSTSLRFYHDNFEVPKELLNIVNETTLRLYVANPPISSSLYSCKLKKEPNKYEGVCLNYVFVGTKPQEVLNFSCISFNWENLNCSWVPIKNAIITKYSITYSLPARHRKVYHCPLKTDVEHNFCLWNASTDPPHRLPYVEYSFQLTGENKLGKSSKSYTINHYAVVLPRKPENLSLVDATSSSLTISWVIPLALRSFPPGIKNKVMYQSKWDPPNYWQEVNTSHVTNISEKRILNITGLKYAHTVYDIRVLLKSEKAEDDEKWWSEPATITLRTKATVPGRPPNTDVGSFESKVQDTYRNIYIYWQQISHNEENGENFEYKIVRIEEYVGSERVERNGTPSAITKTYALFKMMSFNRYVFTIASSNKEGISGATSQVVVPSKHQSPAEPVFLKKIAYEHGVYELSWNAPPHTHNITSYTIFWCDNKNDRPYQCNGFLNWTRVSNNITEKNITLPADKIFQFAISANTNFSSSGMLWADCTVLPDQERGKLKNIWINRIGATFMELSWKLECLQIPGITGFEVSYCPISDPQDLSCREPLKHVLYKGDHTTSHARIEPLRPYTTYKVYLAVQSKKGMGIKSDPLLNTTMEAAPNGPPEELKAIEVTNSSITVSWRPPSLLNGVLRYYKIYWNNNSTHVEDKSAVVTKKLTNLLSYEIYDIRVSACTVACSNKSHTLSIKTEIGMPGQVSAPKVNYFNLTELNVTWTPLESRRGGNVDLYNIKVEILNEEGIILSERFYNKSEIASDKGIGLEILTPGCIISESAQSAQFYNVLVRAVNRGSNGALLAGPWSEPTKGFCYLTKSLSLPYIILLTVVGILALIVICTSVGCITRYMWRRCKAMQNIRVKLPPQLELDIYKDKVNDFPITAHVCPSQHKPGADDNNDIPPPDQQLLLEKKDKEELVESSTEDCEDVNADRESSGCGSGHESVSSSITAGTHITDSGTEADERAASPDVFSDSPRRISDLRLRNVSGSGNGGDGYSRLAQVPSGYVTLPPPFSRGVYVKHDWTPNPPSKPYEITGSMASPNTNPARPQSNEASWTS